MPADSLERITVEIASCTACPLHQTRTCTVPGEGSGSRGLFILGEAPGAAEDAAGRPFIGRSGQLLRSTLASAGLPPEDAFITNRVRCRPPGNRDPRPEELSACRSFLDRQLALLRPRLVVLVGRHALRHFLPDAQITQVHGQVLAAADQPVYPVFHPAAALRDPERMRAFRADLSALPEVLSALAPRSSSRPG